MTTTLDQQIRSLAEEIIDRIVDDPDFREAMKLDGERACEVEGYTQRAADLQARVEDETEVSGFALGILGASFGDVILKSGHTGSSSSGPHCGKNVILAQHDFYKA